MAHQRRKAQGTNLAFLDIMSCGLGAVILIFMLVKQNIEEAPSETEQLKQEISSLEASQAEAQQSLDELREQLAKEKQAVGNAANRLAAKRGDIDSQSSSLKQATADLDKVKQSITQIKVPKKADLIETKQVNEQNYLLGLKVEGKKIVILVDVSASMTNEKLIDIIKTKIGSQQGKVSAPKWQRTKRVVKWLLARVPQNSQIVVIAFSDTAKTLGAGGWHKASQSNVLTSMIGDLNRIVPEGPTNLQKGLDATNKLSPSNIYLITDGLPTKGESRFKSLNPFSSCSSLTGTGKTISGECRKRLFEQTIKESGLKGAKINVVLLPLEGDPEASYEYWRWTASTGGLLISPAGNWP